MKFNWGTGITLFYILFAGSLLYFVIKSTTYDHSLVDKDYYAKDLAYQEHYVKLVNAQALETDLKVLNLLQKQELALYFPPDLGGVSGEITFFCPSDIKADFKVEIDVNKEMKQFIPTAKLKKGLWKVKVDWRAAGKDFYKEETVVF